MVAGLLTDSLSGNLPDGLMASVSGMESILPGKLLELHSSGSVRDFHPIPF